MRDLTAEESETVVGGWQNPVFGMTYASFRIGYAIGSWIYDTYTAWRYSH